MIQRQWLGTSSLQLGDTRRKDHLMLTLQAFYIVILNWILTSVRSIGMQLTPEAHQCREFRWWIYQQDHQSGSLVYKEEGQEMHSRMSQSESDYLTNLTPRLTPSLLPIHSRVFPRKPSTFSKTRKRPQIHLVYATPIWPMTLLGMA